MVSIITQSCHFMQYFKSYKHLHHISTKSPLDDSPSMFSQKPTIPLFKLQ